MHYPHPQQPFPALAIPVQSIETQSSGTPSRRNVHSRTSVVACADYSSAVLNDHDNALRLQAGGGGERDRERGVRAFGGRMIVDDLANRAESRSVWRDD